MKNLLSAFKELVGESVWMDEETKGKAKEKADSIVTMLGYPDWLPSPTELDNYYYGVSIIREGSRVEVSKMILIWNGNSIPSDFLLVNLDFPAKKRRQNSNLLIRNPMEWNFHPR